MFLAVGLPTLLAPGNLPALMTRFGCEYLIYTTEVDAKLLASDEAFQRLRSQIQITVKLFKPSRVRNPISIQNDVWRIAVGYAQQRRALLAFVPPDVAWADGSLARLGDVLAAGKRAIFMTCPRVVSETIVPAMLRRFPRRADGSIVAPAHDLTELVINHIHPIMAACQRSTTHFLVHPEIILWPIKDDGFLLRLLVRELFCLDPERHRLNRKLLMAEMPPQEEVYVFCDSREFLGISLTPLFKDLEWYLTRNALDPLAAGHWWIDYDSPFNDYIASIDVRFTCGRGDEKKWRRAARQADNLVQHLKFSREFMRVLLRLRQMRHVRASAFMAAALRLHGLARRFPHRGPFLVLAPTDAAFAAAHLDEKAASSPNTAVRAMIEAHVAILPVSHEIADGTEITTLTGRRLVLEDTALAKKCGDNILLPINTILSERTPSKTAKRAHARFSKN